MYSDEHFRGYQASKKRYFYGLKIHLMVTQAGQPVECFLTHGGFGDVDALKYYAYELPDGAVIYADRAYTLLSAKFERLDDLESRFQADLDNTCETFNVERRSTKSEKCRTTP